MSHWAHTQNCAEQLLASSCRSAALLFIYPAVCIEQRIWRMRIARLIPRVHLDYVILIAFRPQQWLHERTSLLRCRYIACLVNCIIMHGM